jgi:hypothetical protein
MNYIELCLSVLLSTLSIFYKLEYLLFPLGFLLKDSIFYHITCNCHSKNIHQRFYTLTCCCKSVQVAKVLQCVAKVLQKRCETVTFCCKCVALFVAFCCNSIIWNAVAIKLQHCTWLIYLMPSNNESIFDLRIKWSLECLRFVYNYTKIDPEFNTWIIKWLVKFHLQSLTQ